MDTVNKTKETMPDSMVFIPAGKFLMGSDKFYPEEKPVHEVTVDGFYIDKYEVTNEEYKKFVDETGYVTVAERPLESKRLSRCKSRIYLFRVRLYFKNQKDRLI